jgi:glycosyltransferase involved in cell wall biosynthesis
VRDFREIGLQLILQDIYLQHLSLNWFATPRIEQSLGSQVVNLEVLSSDYSKTLLKESDGLFDYMGTLELVRFLQNLSHEDKSICATMVIFTDSHPAIVCNYSKELFSRFKNLFIIFGDNSVSHFERNNTFLSIVVPIYNVSTQIPELLDSLDPLVPFPIEFIFVNDGSTDNSENLIKSWCSDKPKARLISKENGGCATARNVGLLQSEGNYIMFVDGDDTVDPVGILQSLVYLSAFTPDIAVGNYSTFVGTQNHSVPVDNYPWIKHRPVQIDFKTLVNQQPTIWRCFYRREFLKAKNLSFFEVERFDDLPFWFQATMTAESVMALEENLYYWRLEREGQSMGARDERLNVHFEIFRFLDDWVASYSRSFVRTLWQTKADTHSWALERIEPTFKRGYRKKARRDLFGSTSKLNLIELIWALRIFYQRKGLKEALWVIKLRFI